MSGVEAHPPGTCELVAVGDISLGDSPQSVGGGVRARFDRVRDGNPRYPFEHTAPLFAGAGIVFGNLETVLSHRGAARWNASSMEMRGHPAAAARLAEAGFTVLNLANNHMMQHGAAAFADTVDALGRHRIGIVGRATRDRRACVPYQLSVNGLTVTLLGFAFERDKYAAGPVEYAFGPDADIPAEIAAARAQSDVVICSAHWGVEFVRHPSREEEELGRRWVDAGADLVLGHHPHVARRVERYGRGVIAYSLGNFVFDQVWNRWLRTGLLLRAVLSRAGVTGIETQLIGIGDDYQPHRLDGPAAAAAAGDFEALRERPAWASSDAQYSAHYEELVRRNRYESYRHFLRTLHQRPLIYSAQTLLGTARRKAAQALGLS
jgi:poly-gamma-glutamate synthesis protein (capsule biosynthesis protein)